MKMSFVSGSFCDISFGVSFGISCCLFSALSLRAPRAEARDLGFRYVDGQCVDAQGKPGLNPALLGPCGDLRHVILARLDLSDMDLSGTRFDSSDVQESSFQHANLTGTNFSGVNLAGVDLTAAIIRGANFSEAIMKNAHLANAVIANVNFENADFSGSQLSYLSLVSCNLKGAIFANAVLDHADFGGASAPGADFAGATLSGARFDHADISGANMGAADLTGASLAAVTATGASFRSASLRGASLSDGRLGSASFRSAKMDGVVLSRADLAGADLRSAVLPAALVDGASWKAATFNQRTVLPFGAEVAQNLGMTFQKGGNLFVIWDIKSADELAFAKALQDGGVDVAFSEKNASTFAGEAKLADYSAVLHLNGSENTDMPDAGQKALVDFVKNGGTYISTEWNALAVQLGHQKGLRDLILLDCTDDTPKGAQFVPVAAQKNHPVLEGFVQPVQIQTYFCQGKAHVFADQPSTVLMQNENGDDLVMARTFGAGKVVYVDVGINYGFDLLLADPNVEKLITNALNW